MSTSGRKPTSLHIESNVVAKAPIRSWVAEWVTTKEYRSPYSAGRRLGHQQHCHGVDHAGRHPPTDLAGVKPHRHPVVDICGNDAVTSDDGEGAQVAIRQQRAGAPPEAGGQQRACGVDESRIFVPVLEPDGPFVATSQGCDAAALLEHRPEGRLRDRRVDAGIDGRTLQAFGLRPAGQEPQAVRVTC